MSHLSTTCGQSVYVTYPTKQQSESERAREEKEKERGGEQRAGGMGTEDLTEGSNYRLGT